MTKGNKTTTLVIHAPDHRVKQSGSKSFEEVLADGRGKAYAIRPHERERLAPGSTVVLLRKDGKKQRAEGRLVKLCETGVWTRNGIMRLDVHVEGLELVPYRSERLTRRGVAVY